MANRTVSVRLMADIGQYVGGMNTAAAATMRLGDSATKSTAQAKSGFDIAGKGALLMGAAVVGGLAMAVSKSMEFEKAMSAAAAATQASGAALGDLRAAAMKAGADTQYSATEAANAITEMGKAGVSTADILGGGLTGALSLAAAGQLDVAKAAEIASVAMTQFKLSGNQLPHVADLLAAGAGKAMGSVEDLGMALNQAGLVASSTGLSIEETTGSLAAFASAGLIGSDAGTSLRSMLLHLQNATGPAAEEMERYGISLYDAAGNFVGMESLAGQLQSKLGGLTQQTRDAAMAQIFGSDAVRAANVLYTEGSAGIAEWTAKVNDQGYAAEQAAKLNDNLAGDLERLGGAFDTLLISIGEGTQGPLRMLVQMLESTVEGVTWLIDTFQSLPGPVQAALAALIAVKVLGGPLNSMMDFLSPKITGLATGMGMAAANAGGFRGALSSMVGAINPVTLALTAATVGITYYLQESAKVEARLEAAADAGESFRSTLALQHGEMDETARAAADLAIEAAGLSDAFRDLGLSGAVINSALAGNADAYRETLTALEEYDRQQTVTSNGFVPMGIGFDVLTGKATENADAFRELNHQTGDYFLTVGNVDAGGWGKQVEAQNASTAATAAATAQTEEATQALEDWLTQLQEVAAGFVEPLATYQGLLNTKTEAERAAAEETAAATESSTDSWRDYVGDVTVSLDELATKLEEQLLAQDNWRANIVTITQRGGLEVGQAIAAMGEEGVQLAAQMANGTDAEFQRMAALIIEDARRGGAGAAAALDNEMKVMAAIAAAGSKATVTGIASQLGLGIAQVQAIAAQYGIALASGINPILTGLGKKPIAGVGGRLGGLNEFADGGFTGPGGKYTPAGFVHAGEIVWSQDDIAAHGGVSNVEAMRTARSGYADGGFVSTASVPKPRSTAPYGHPFSTAADATMSKEYADVTEWLNANLAGGGIFEGGTGLVAALQFARSQVGKPYIWAGVGPNGYDCSGFMSAITNVIRGRSPYSRVGATASFPWSGFTSGPGSFTIGSTKNAGGGIGHMAGTLLGVNVESAGGVGVRVGGSARGSNDGLFGTRAHLATYDQGGPLHPGYTLAYNGTGQTEWVSREMPGSSGSGSGGGAVSVSIEGAQIVGTLDLGEGITARIDGRVVKALTAAGGRRRYNP